MNFSFVVRDRRGDLSNIPADKADGRDREDAVAARVVCKAAAKADAKALLLKAKSLGFEGDLKEGTFRDGSVWMTLGRRSATSTDNADAFAALVG